MRKKVVFTTGLTFLIAALCLLAAQEPGGQAPQRPHQGGEGAMGTISSVGVDRFEVKRTDGTSQTVLVDEQTRYREEQKEIQLEDLKQGDRVFVRGRMNADKQLVAVMVRRVTDAEIQRFQNGGERAFGEILSIQNNEIKVRSPMAGERTIVVNDQTEFMKEGQPITLKDLKVGDRIFAAGKVDQGKFVAARVFTGRFRGRGQGQEQEKH